MSHHPYVAGYSVLPGLRPIAIGDVFEPISTDALARYLADKQDALRGQICRVESELTPEIADAVHDFIVTHHPVDLSGCSTLDDIALQIPEDLVIHCADGNRDWMAYGNVCFASDWRPEEKIGLSFREVHVPVPGMNLAASDRLVHAMIHAGPFERFVWSVVHEPRLNFHPRFPKRRFDPDAPCVYLKVERQTTVGFPDLGAALFSFRQHLLGMDDIQIPALIAALERMTPPQRAYKGLTDSAEPLIAWLRSQLG